MRTIKRGLAVFLALILMLPSMPVSASQASITNVSEETVSVAETEETSVAETTSEEISDEDGSESVSEPAETE